MHLEPHQLPYFLLMLALFLVAFIRTFHAWTRNGNRLLLVLGRIYAAVLVAGAVLMLFLFRTN